MPSRRSMPFWNNLKNQLKKDFPDLRSEVFWNDEKHYDEFHHLRQLTMNISRVSLLTVFDYADCFDKFLMASGILFAVAMGCIFPLTLLSVVGIILNISEICPASDANKFRAISKQCFYSSLGLCAVAFACFFCWHLSMARQELKIREAYLKAILSKDVTWHDSFLARKLSDRIIYDIGRMTSELAFTIPYVTAMSLSTLLLILFMFVIHATYAVFALFTSVAVLVIVNWLKVYFDMEMLKQTWIWYKPANEVAAEILPKVRCIKLLGVAETEIERYVETLSDSKPRAQAIPTVLIQSVQHFAQLFLMALIVGAYTVGRQESHKCAAHGWELHSYRGYEQFISVHFLGLYVILALTKIPLRIVAARRILSMIAEVFFVIKWPSVIDTSNASGGMTPVFGSSGSYSLRNVSFAYPTKRTHPVLKDISLNIHSGEMVTIFGPNDVGKSALIKLLQRSYDANSGEIQFDGHDIQQYDITWLRSQIGCVPLKPVFFDGSVIENLKLANEDVSDIEVMAMCDSLKLHDFIMRLPQDYDTRIGASQGFRIPALQMQKLALAQVLLRKCQVVILHHEITMGDLDFEQLLLEELSRLHGKRTIILCSNRFNDFIRMSDKVFVLKDGQIVASGNHYRMIEGDQVYIGALKESLGYQQDIALTDNNQLQKYRFAKALTERHESSDARHTLGFADAVDMNKYRNSILLRQQFEEPYHQIHLRHIGSICAVDVLPVDYPQRPYQKSITHELFRKRDFRLKFLPDQLIKNEHSHQQLVPAGPTNSTEPRPTSSRDLHLYSSPQERKYSAVMRLTQYVGFAMSMPLQIQRVTSAMSINFWKSYSHSLAPLPLPISRNGKELLKELFRQSWQMMPFIIGANLATLLLFVLSFTFFGSYQPSLETSVGLFAAHPIVRVELSLLYLGLALAIKDFLLALAYGFYMTRTVKKMRVQLIKYFLSLDLDKYFSNECDVGYLLNTLYTSPYVLAMGLASSATTGLSFIMGLVTAITWTFIVFDSWILPLTICYVIFAVSDYFESFFILQLPLGSQNYLSRSRPLLEDALNNIRVLQTSNMEGVLYNEGVKRLREDYQRSKVVVWTKCLCFAVSSSLIFLTVSLSHMFIKNVQLSGKNDDEFLFFYVVLFFIVDPAGGAMASLPSNETLYATDVFCAAREFRNLQSSKPVIKSLTEDNKTAPISVRNVTFAYASDPSNLKLNQVSFEIQRGSCIGIAGPRKSGKSTLMSILSGLLTPTSGGVYLGDVNIHHLDAKTFRSQIGFAENDSEFWNWKTIKENIIFGSEETGGDVDQRVFAAAKMAMIKDYVLKMKKGFATVLGHLPPTMETFMFRNLLALARVAYQDPAIVLIKDVASATDAEGEAIFKTAINNLRQNRTMIISSNRVKALEGVDKIMVLFKGQLVEQGTRQELVKEKGVFYELEMEQGIFEDVLS